MAHFDQIEGKKRAKKAKSCLANRTANEIKIERKKKLEKKTCSTRQI